MGPRTSSLLGPPPALSQPLSIPNVFARSFLLKMKHLCLTLEENQYEFRNHT